MGIELRKGRFYLYRRRRENGRIRCEYQGAVCPQGAALLRLTGAEGRAKRERQRKEAEAEAKVERADGLLAIGADFDQLADLLFRVVMRWTGHRLHKRSEWRRTRRVAAMGKLKQIAPAPTDAKGHLKTITPSLDDREILARAANGDLSVIPQVTQLMKSPARLEVYGSSSERAFRSILAQAAGNDVAVVIAMAQKHREYIAKQLADGPDPTFAEQMAATRAAHNWLIVHSLEIQATKYAASSPTAVMIDKRATLAERRLHASLRSLAVLRRLRKPVVLKQVNSAPGGTVVVKI